MRVLQTSNRFYFFSAVILALSGCLGNTKRDKEDPTGKSIPEITKIVRDSEYGRENALAYYWIFRVQAENIRIGGIEANQAERIGQSMVQNFGLKKGAVDGLADAIQKQLKPWAGDKDLLEWPDGYCNKLMEIAESCRRAAK